MNVKAVLRALIALTVVAGFAVTCASSTSVLGMGQMETVCGRGNCLCNAYVTCLQCEKYGSTWVECSNSSNKYLECKDGGAGDNCGDCLAYGSDCGTYRTCEGPGGCVNCNGDQACEGCTSGEGSMCS